MSWICLPFSSISFTHSRMVQIWLHHISQSTVQHPCTHSLGKKTKLKAEGSRNGGEMMDFLWPLRLQKNSYPTHVLRYVKTVGGHRLISGRFSFSVKESSLKKISHPQATDDYKNAYMASVITTGIMCLSICMQRCERAHVLRPLETGRKWEGDLNGPFSIRLSECQQPAVNTVAWWETCREAHKEGLNQGRPWNGRWVRRGRGERYRGVDGVREAGEG